MKYLNNIKIENNKDMQYGMLTQITQYGHIVFSYIFMIGLFINLLFFISVEFDFNFEKIGIFECVKNDTTDSDNTQQNVNVQSSSINTNTQTNSNSQITPNNTVRSSNNQGNMNNQRSGSHISSLIQR